MIIFLIDTTWLSNCSSLCHPNPYCLWSTSVYQWYGSSSTSTGAGKWDSHECANVRHRDSTELNGKTTILFSFIWKNHNVVTNVPMFIITPSSLFFLIPGKEYFKNSWLYIPHIHLFFSDMGCYSSITMCPFWQSPQAAGLPRKRKPLISLPVPTCSSRPAVIGWLLSRNHFLKNKNTGTCSPPLW